MKKVYIITYEDKYSNGEYYSGVSYTYDSFEKAKKMLNSIKLNEIDEAKDNGYDITNDVKETENSFKIDRADTFEYKIIEMNVE